MRRLFLLKTPSQSFSSPKSRASRHVLAAGGSRARGWGRIESTCSTIGSYPQHPSSFVMIVFCFLCSPCCFSGVTACGGVSTTNHPASYASCLKGRPLHEQGPRPEPPLASMRMRVCLRFQAIYLGACLACWIKLGI